MALKIDITFRKPVNFKVGYGAESYFPLGKKPVVCITDYDPNKDWSLPCGYFNDEDKMVWFTKDVGNPKVKKMSRKDFINTFKITGCKYFTDYARFKDKVYYSYPKTRLFIDRKIITPVLNFIVWLRLA